MRTFRRLLQTLVIRAVDICRLLTIILREYRKSGLCGLSGCHG